MKPLITSVLLLIWIAVLASTVRVNAQDPLDGPARIFNDDLLNNLVGDWKLKREIQGRTVENTVTAEWVLNHQFLRIHMKDVKTPATYEAMVLIGYDNTSERYVVHWLDVFGGRFSAGLRKAKWKLN